jgi:ferredoxin
VECTNVCPNEALTITTGLDSGNQELLKMR